MQLRFQFFVLLSSLPSVFDARNRKLDGTSNVLILIAADILVLVLSFVTDLRGWDNSLDDSNFFFIFGNLVFAFFTPSLCMVSFQDLWGLNEVILLF
jgi:hypothetical protein